MTLDEWRREVERRDEIIAGEVVHVEAVISERDALKAERDRLRVALEQCADALEAMTHWTECRCISAGCDHQKAHEAHAAACAVLEASK